MTPEGSLEASFIRLCKKNGVWCLKTEPIWKGFPDRMVLGPDRRVAFVELKTPIGQLSQPQIDAHDVLRRLGWTVLVPRTKADLEALLRDFLR